MASLLEAVWATHRPSFSNHLSFYFCPQWLWFSRSKMIKAGAREKLTPTSIEVVFVLSWPWLWKPAHPLLRHPDDSETFLMRCSFRWIICHQFNHLLPPSLFAPTIRLSLDLFWHFQHLRLALILRSGPRSSSSPLVLDHHLPSSHLVKQNPLLSHRQLRHLSYLRLLFHPLLLIFDFLLANYHSFSKAVGLFLKAFWFRCFLRSISFSRIGLWQSWQYCT